MEEMGFSASDSIWKAETCPTWLGGSSERRRAKGHAGSGKVEMKNSSPVWFHRKVPLGLVGNQATFEGAPNPLFKKKTKNRG